MSQPQAQQVTTVPDSYDINFIHLMIDLETLSTRPNAAILSVGVLPFLSSTVTKKFGDDPSPWVSKHQELLMDRPIQSFYKVFSQIGQTHRNVNLETLEWWEGQSDEARKVLTESRAKTNNVSVQIDCLVAYLEDIAASNEDAYLIYWGNGASFDNPILKSLMEEIRGTSMSGIWSHKHDICYRSLMNMYKHLETTEVENVGTHHHALDDCTYQAQRILGCMPEEAFGILNLNLAG